MGVVDSVCRTNEPKRLPMHFEIISLRCFARIFLCKNAICLFIISDLFSISVTSMGYLRTEVILIELSNIRSAAQHCQFVHMLLEGRFPTSSMFTPTLFVLKPFAQVFLLFQHKDGLSNPK